MRIDRFNCGWNDVAHGILEWTPGETYPTSQGWAEEMRRIARSIQDHGTDDGYHAGVVAVCCVHLAGYPITKK
jgi:hypothetical protein